MTPAEVLDFNGLPQVQKDNIAVALEHYMFQYFSGHYDERIERDPEVRKKFRPLEGPVCDLVLRRGNRYTLAEAKGEQDVGKARVQFENTISRIIQCKGSAVFSCLAVFIRRGLVYADLPLNSTEGLGRHLELDDLGGTAQFRLDSAHVAQKKDKNYHVLLEPSGDPCLPIPQSSSTDRWGISRIVPPEIRIYVTKFRLPPS